VPIEGSADNNTGVTFDPTHQLQRTGLLLIGGTVYAGFGSHCGITPYKGWVFGVGTGGQIEARWSTEDRFNDGAGVWQTGGAPLSDGSNTFIVSTGNGESTPDPTPGNTPPDVLGESWIRLTVQGNGTLVATDFFTPTDAPSLNLMDGDFGSGGPMGLPDSMGTPSVPHLGMGAGKQGYLYLLDRDDLGGFRQGPGGSDKVVQRLDPSAGSGPAPQRGPARAAGPTCPLRRQETRPPARPDSSTSSPSGPTGPASRPWPWPARPTASSASDPARPSSPRTA
jgi:hypothetical protein